MEYGLIGEKLSHSFSKIVHSMIGDYKYELVEIEKDNIENFIKEKKFKAVNVTIPYKEIVLKYLDYISPEAEKIGAVNVIVNKSGKLFGYNSDYYGFISLLKRKNINVSEKNALILGSGGTSKTVLTALQSLGCNNVYRASRTPSQNTISYDDAMQKNINIIINTTPVGMYPNIYNSAIDINKFSGIEAVVDVIYNPLSSLLVQKAFKKNINSTGGLFMLVAQAVEAAKLFGFDVSEQRLDDIYKTILSEKKNIVLIGMPSCGKSTIGKKIAKKLNKEFIDSDEFILKKIPYSSISTFIKERSEKEFREIEASVIKDISKDSGCVISTGGGAILNKENVDNLKLNGVLVFINRKLELLTPSESRPLTSTKEMLCAKFKERFNLYKECADIEVENNSDIETALRNVINSFNNIISNS